MFLEKDIKDAANAAVAQSNQAVIGETSNLRNSRKRKILNADERAQKRFLHILFLLSLF
jgi:hypothetical protein